MLKQNAFATAENLPHDFVRTNFLHKQSKAPKKCRKVYTSIRGNVSHDVFPTDTFLPKGSQELSLITTRL